MTDRLLLAATVVIGVPIVLIGYITLIEWLLRQASARRQAALRPWLWLAPAFAFLAVFLLYPAVNTFYLSFFGPSSERFVGLANYAYVFGDGTMLLALRNNLIWLVFFTLLTVTFGLLVAVLTDQI